jgi:hypothetical protein
MNLVNCDKARKTQVRGVRKPEARFWVGQQGKLTSQWSLLTKSNGKIKGQPEPHKSPCGSRRLDGTKLDSSRSDTLVGPNGNSICPFGKIREGLNKMVSL